MMCGNKGSRQEGGSSSSYLTNAAALLGFRWKMLMVECRVFDHPKAANDLVFAQPCAYIPNSVLESQ